MFNKNSYFISYILSISISDNKSYLYGYNIRIRFVKNKIILFKINILIVNNHYGQ